MGFGKALKSVFKASSAMVNPVGAIATIGSMGADLYSADQAAKAQRSANDANVAFSVGQNAWQKMMSDTSHQREVADLKAAGLNPVLSANAGASTPVGSTPEVEAVPPRVPAGLVRNNLASAIEMRRLKKDLDEADSRIKFTNKQTQKLGQDITAQKPLADLGTFLSRGFEKYRSSANVFRNLLRDGPPEFDGDEYISSAEQKRRAHNARNKKRYSPRGKNVPLYIGE